MRINTSCSERVKLLTVNIILTLKHFVCYFSNNFVVCVIHTLNIVCMRCDVALYKQQ